MKDKLLYYFINTFFWSLTIIAIMIIKPFNSIEIDFPNFFLLIIAFILIHGFKCLRQYLLLMESRIHINDFIKLYFQTTFCSIVLPYKFGELYKMYIYGRKINNYLKGFMVVVVDKVFDAVLLLFLFIPYEYKNNISHSPITWLLFIFVIGFIAIYFSFKQTYYYLNKHFMLNSNSNRTIYVLKILENCNKIYQDVRAMIRGRELILMLFTTFSWAIEYLFIRLLNSGEIMPYITAVFFGTQNILVQSYIFIGSVCLIFILIVLLLTKIGGYNEESNDNI
ncbi:MAG: hypothetical protein E7172_02885 [Firmicutes bacterium]|nr:hypothetical protein [Bacillota bacterium]